MITHLDPDILECEVNWVLWSITVNKASGGDGIPAVLLQILKDDAVKVVYSVCKQIWKTQQWPQDWKRLVFIPIPKKGNAKECSNYRTTALISHASKVMLKFSKRGFNRTSRWRELPDVQAGLGKGRGTRNQIANIHWITEKAREFQKSTCLIDYAEAFHYVQFSHSVVSDSLQPHGLQHARLPCPSPAPRACSNSGPSSQQCHPTISCSVDPFFCLQPCPTSGSFPKSQFFASGGQNTGTSASVLPMNIQDWVPLGWTGWISFFSNTTVQKHQFFNAQLFYGPTLTSIHDYWKNHSFD